MLALVEVALVLPRLHLPEERVAVVANETAVAGALDETVDDLRHLLPRGAIFQVLRLGDLLYGFGHGNT